MLPTPQPAHVLVLPPSTAVVFARVQLLHYQIQTLRCVPALHQLRSAQPHASVLCLSDGKTISVDVTIHGATTLTTSVVASVHTGISATTASSTAESPTSTCSRHLPTRRAPATLLMSLIQAQRLAPVGPLQRWSMGNASVSPQESSIPSQAHADALPLQPLTSIPDSAPATLPPPWIALAFVVARLPRPSIRAQAHANVWRLSQSSTASAAATTPTEPMLPESAAATRLTTCTRKSVC